MNKNILHTWKARVFVDFYEPINYASMIFCFRGVVSCVERLDANGFKFSGNLCIAYVIEFNEQDRQDKQITVPRV